MLLDHGDNNIFTQIGLLVLVGLACKNAILIVEFAKHLQEERGRDARSRGARGRAPAPAPDPHDLDRLHHGRRAADAGAAAPAPRCATRSGVTVFAGMLGVTVFGLLLTPVFYVLVRRAAARRAPADGALRLPAAEVSHE